MMLRIALFLLALATPLRAEVAIQEVISPGGIKAWLVEEHGIPFTALELRFKGGTSLDRPGKRGEVNLMTALIEEGAGSLDSQGFAPARDAPPQAIGCGDRRERVDADRRVGLHARVTSVSRRSVEARPRVHAGPAGVDVGHGGGGAAASGGDQGEGKASDTHGREHGPRSRTGSTPRERSCRWHPAGHDFLPGLRPR